MGDDEDIPPDLLNLAYELLDASQSKSSSAIRRLLTAGAPAWYQDDQLGWSCLHYAAERREPHVLTTLLDGGAVWNAVDHWGRTAGDISLSLGDREGWEVIRNQGIRSGELEMPCCSSPREMLRHVMGEAPESSNAVTLRATDSTSAGDNSAFLLSELRWEVGEDGKERVLDGDGNGSASRSRVA